MQYQVPQFINVESKIVGPLTLKQFGFLAAGFLLIFFSFFILNFLVWLIFALFIAAISLAFAFLKHNNRSFSVLVISVFRHFWRAKKYTFRKEPTSLKSNEGIEDLSLRLYTSKKPIKNERFKLPFLKRFQKATDKFEILRKVTGDKEVARRVDYR